MEVGRRGERKRCRGPPRAIARVGWGGRKSARVGLGTRGSGPAAEIFAPEPVRGGGA